MKIEPLKFCWLDLGEGKVCERVAGHDGECSPDPTVDFPIDSRQSLRAMRVELPDPNWLREAIPTYTCPHCERSSTNPQDIANRYCGHCRHFCDEVPPWT